MNKQGLLFELGKTIRKYGKQERKRHGSEWTLKLKSGIVFKHDDYNHMVIAFHPDNSRFYYGMSFGGFTGQDVSELNYKATIEMIDLEFKHMLDTERAHVI